MKNLLVETTCTLCGGIVFAPFNIAYDWSLEIYHKNPQMCKEHLKSQNEKEKKSVSTNT